MKNKALFLDRDGTINYQKTGEYVYKIKDFIFLPDIIGIMKYFQNNGFLLIVITNQGCIDKGLCSLHDVKVLHDQIKDVLFSDCGIVISGIFVCPHHPSITKCNCRKPQTTLVERAVEIFNIDKSKSYFIGDSENDELCAKKSGIKFLEIELNKPTLPKDFKLK